MTHTIWRIASDTPDYASDEVSGSGAQVTGGRWNRKGIPLLYSSGSIALACLETLVHLGGSSPLPLNRYLVKIDVPDEAWNQRMIFTAADHVGWDSLPAGLVSLDWGSRWANSKATLLADVPSVVVPEEANILLNPKHSDASTITVKKLRRWTYEVRAP